MKNLLLNKITGIRHDKGQFMSKVPVIQPKKLKTSPKSMKTTENKKQGKWKY